MKLDPDGRYPRGGSSNAQAAQALRAKLSGTPGVGRGGNQTEPSPKALRPGSTSNSFAALDPEKMETDGEKEEEEDVQEELKAQLKNRLKEKNDAFSGGKEPDDAVRLGEEGWKRRYYETKFGVKNDQECEEVVRDVVSSHAWLIHSHSPCLWPR